MRQVQQNYRSGELKVCEVPAPCVSAGEILVETRISLISAGTEKQLTDLAKASLAGKAMARPDLVRRVVRNVSRDGVRPTIEKVFAKLDTPIPLGYSLAGQVIELGRHMGGLAVGDRVACAGAGIANHAEFNAVPKNLCVKIPDGVSDEDASFVTLGAIALQGVRQVAPTLGEKVVVMGLGLIGLLTVQLLKANGCRVLGFDPNEQRVRLAREIGADVAVADSLPDSVNAFTNGFGADAVVITASSKSSEIINISAEISRLKGRIVVVGLVGMTIDREPFYKRELELRLSMSYGPGRHDPSYELAGHDYPFAYVRWTEQRNMETFLSLIAEGKVTPGRLVTHRFPIADATKAYALMEGSEPYLAILLTYPEKNRSAPLRLVRQHTSPPPEGKLQVAFVGLGNYARGVLLPAVKKVPDVGLASVVTATGISASHGGERYGFANISTDSATVLDDSDIDAVFIATRHDTHAGLAEAALRAGKHVFCEKPLALDLETLTNVVSASASAPGVLAVGFNRRFSPFVQKAKSALEPRSGPLVMLYRVNAGTIPGDSWIQQAEGGGRIVGEICHFVDTLVYVSGSLPTKVFATSAHGHADALSVLITFADGSTGTIVYSSIGDPRLPKEYIEIFASGCVVQIDDFARICVTKNGRQKASKSAQDKGQRTLVASFLEAAKGKRPWAVDISEPVAVTTTTFAIEESLRTGLPASCRFEPAL